MSYLWDDVLAGVLPSVPEIAAESLFLIIWVAARESGSVVCDFGSMMGACVRRPSL